MKHILLKKFSPTKLVVGYIWQTDHNNLPRLVYIYKRNLDQKTKVVCIFKILTSKFYKKGF